MSLKLLDMLGMGRPGTLKVRESKGFVLGAIPAANLPPCGAAREGEERRVVGSGPTASRTVRCAWTGATWGKATTGALTLTSAVLDAHATPRR